MVIQKRINRIKLELEKLPPEFFNFPSNKRKSVNLEGLKKPLFDLQKLKKIRYNRHSVQLNVPFNAIKENKEQENSDYNKNSKNNKNNNNNDTNSNSSSDSNSNSNTSNSNSNTSNNNTKKNTKKNTEKNTINNTNNNTINNTKK